MGALNTAAYDPAELAAVFGDRSRGTTPNERAKSSDKEFVRSQLQLAFATAKATGHRLTAQEALDIFGWDVLLRVGNEGSIPLISKSDEPAATLENRRNQINLPIERLARQCGLPDGAIRRAETRGLVSPIRDLEKIAQALALDERVLGYVPEAGGDKSLGFRLRELARDAHHFSAGIVLGLSEAAWVISRQASLAASLGELPHQITGENGGHDHNYAYPVWEQGYRLAAKTRQLLELGEEDPIESLRSLMEEKLGIPLVQESLDRKFAGATVSNGYVRGIVVNEQGMNSNVWVRRMTLCHELGHLLWDPDQRLNKLVVDEYEDLEKDYAARPDAVEIRANAFAVAFLAPPAGVRRAVSDTENTLSAVTTVMEKFGISATAAIHHVRNVTSVDTAQVANVRLPRPSGEWLVAENLSVDYFPIETTPISRRGRFAFFVIAALQKNQISTDTAALFLRCSVDEIARRAATMSELLGVPQRDS